MEKGEIRLCYGQMVKQNLGLLTPSWCHIAMQNMVKVTQFVVIICRNVPTTCAAVQISPSTQLWTSGVVQSQLLTICQKHVFRTCNTQNQARIKASKQINNTETQLCKRVRRHWKYLFLIQFSRIIAKLNIFYNVAVKNSLMRIYTSIAIWTSHLFMLQFKDLVT